MPNVSIYLKDQVYRRILAEADAKGLKVATLIKMKVEDFYGEEALRAEREKIRPGIRK